LYIGLLHAASDNRGWARREVFKQHLASGDMTKVAKHAFAILDEGLLFEFGAPLAIQLNNLL
jgi:hypothetical protein